MPDGKQKLDKPNDDSSIQALTKSIAHIFKTGMSDGNRSQPRWNGRQPDANRNRPNKSNVTCYYCHKVGHMKNECRTLIRNLSQQQSAPTISSQTNQRVCYNCKQPGHFARKCRALMPAPRANIPRFPPNTGNA